MSRAALGLALGLSVTACADPCADLGPAELELGSADEAGVDFLPLEAGSTQRIHPGLQGGAHVWLHARVAGLCPATTVIDRRVLDAETSEVFVLGRGPVDFVEIADGRYELDGAVRMQLCPDPGRRAVDGRAMRFVVAAQDAEGRRADARVAFTPSCEGDPRCEDLCRAP